MRNILSLCIFFLMACVASKPHQKIKQGIYGTILLKTGNQMPGPGRTPDAGQPVMREIAIYKLTNLTDVKSDNGIFYAIKTALVAKVRSNKNGYYQIALPAGEYSVFTIEKEGFFASNFDGKGNINAVRVVPDSLSRKDIIISDHAAF